MDSMMAVEITQTLEREFNISLTAKQIRNMTFAKLNAISNTNINETQTAIMNKDLTKERKLLFGVLRNEDFVSDICLHLSTDQKNNSTHVFLLPGIENSATIFNQLVSKIKFSATSLQYGNIEGVSTIPEMADYLSMVCN